MKEYRRLGASVKPTHNVGQGFGDAVIGLHGINDIIEIKDPRQPPSKRKLTPDEQEFHDSWKGLILIIETNNDVKEHIESMRIRSEALQSFFSEYIIKE